MQTCFVTFQFNTFNMNCEVDKDGINIYIIIFNIFLETGLHPLYFYLPKYTYSYA